MENKINETQRYEIAAQRMASYIVERALPKSSSGIDNYIKYIDTETKKANSFLGWLLENLFGTADAKYRRKYLERSKRLLPKFEREREFIKKTYSKLRIPGDSREKLSQIEKELLVEGYNGRSPFDGIYVQHLRFYCLDQTDKELAEILNIPTERYEGIPSDALNGSLNYYLTQNADLHVEQIIKLMRKAWESYKKDTNQGMEKRRTREIISSSVTCGPTTASRQCEYNIISLGKALGLNEEDAFRLAGGSLEESNKMQDDYYKKRILEEGSKDKVYY